MFCYIISFWYSPGQVTFSSVANSGPVFDCIVLVKYNKYYLLNIMINIICENAELYTACFA